MAIVRTDTTLVGPCDGLPCWIIVSDSYPPTTDNLYNFAYSTNNQQISLQQIDTSSLSTVTLGDNLVPILAIPNLVSRSGTNVTMTIKCYNITDGSYIGNIAPANGFILNPDDTHEMTYTVGDRAASYSPPSILSSIAYAYNIGPHIPNSPSTSAYLFFVTRASYNNQCTIFPGDSVSLNNGDGSYSYPTQVNSLLQIILNSSIDSTLNGYTSVPACSKFSSIGMIFYSNGSCGDSVSFQGIDNTTQSSSTSYGPCDNSSCTYSNSEFTCPPSSDNNQQSNSAIIVALVIGIILIAVVLIVIVIVNNKKKSQSS